MTRWESGEVRMWEVPGLIQGWGTIGIVSTFFGVLHLGGSHAEKRGDHQKKKFFINNSVEDLILCNEEDQGLLKL